MQQILDARSEPRCYCPEGDSAKAERRPGGGLPQLQTQKEFAISLPPTPPLTLRTLNQTKTDAVTEHFIFKDRLILL